MVDVVIQLGDDCKINEIYYTKTGVSRKFGDAAKQVVSNLKVVGNN